MTLYCRALVLWQSQNKQAFSLGRIVIFLKKTNNRMLDSIASDFFPLRNLLSFPEAKTIYNVSVEVHKSHINRPILRCVVSENGWLLSLFMDARFRTLAETRKFKTQECTCPGQRVPEIRLCGQVAGGITH